VVPIGERAGYLFQRYDLMSMDRSERVRRTVNWPVLVGTIVIFGVTGAGLYFLHRYRVQQTAAEMLSVAEAREKDEEWLKAAEYLERYLRLKPKDVPARSRMTLNYARHANSAKSWILKRQAIDLHYRALAAGDTQHERELRLSLLELLLDHKRFQEAEKEARRVLEKDSDSAPATKALAIALASQLEDGSLSVTTSKGLKILKNVERARKLNPSDSRLATILSVLLRDYPILAQNEYPGISERERHEKADENFEEFIQANAQSAQAHLARNAYRVKYGLSDANNDLEAGLALAPEDPEVLLASAVAAFDSGRRLQLRGGDAKAWKDEVARAKTYFERLINGPREHQIEQSYVGLGDCYLVLGEPDQAIKTWEEGLKQFKQTTTLINLHSRIAETALDRDLISTATTALDAIDELLVKLGTSVRREDKLALTRSQDLRRATLHMKQQNTAAALPLLRQVVVSQPKGDKNVQASVKAWVQLGTINAAQGEWMDAATAFDQATALQPDLVQARLAASTSWLYAGRADLATDRAEQALQQSNVAGAWLALALAQVQQQAQQPPQQRSWVRLEKALNVLEGTKRQLPEPWRVDFLRAEYTHIRAKDQNHVEQSAAEALKILQAAEKQYGAQKPFMLQLAVVYQTLKQNGEADRLLVELKKAGASPAELALLEGRLASLRGEYERAQAILQEGLKSATAQYEQQMRNELLSATFGAKDLQQARTMLLHEHRQRPQHVGTLRRLAELDLEQRNLNAIRQWEDKLQATGPLGEPHAQYVRAWRLFLSSAGEKDQQLHDALRELEQVMLARANWAEAATLKGMIEQRLGRKEQAVAAYERAVQLGERRLNVFEQLIALLDVLKRSADVDRYLARLESDIPLSQRLAEMASTQQMRRERPEQAIEIAKARAAQRPEDPMAQLWLGRMLAINNKLQEAEGPLRKATDLAPADARYWNALVDCYIRMRSRKSLENTVERISESEALEAIQKHVLLARCHEALGNQEQAQRSYSQASDSAPGDVPLHLRVAQFYLQRNPQQAKTHLETALKLEPASVAAKQMLAIVYAALGQLDEAAALLSVANDDGAVAADDVRLSALLLLQRGGEANLDMAAGKLEELLRRSTESGEQQATDRLLLSRLYEQQARLAREPQARTERLEAAEQQLKDLVVKADASAMHLSALVQFYQRQQRSDDAAIWLDRLDTLVLAMPKDDPATLTLLVQLYLQQELPQKAEKWVVKLEKVDSTSLRTLAIRARVALALDGEADLKAVIEPKATELVDAAATVEEKQQLMGAVGDLYSGLKRDANAESWYRRLWQEDATRYAPLVRSIKRQGRLKEAIGLCEQAVQVDTSVQPYLELSNILIEGKPTAEDFAMADKQFEAALTKFGSDVRLLYALGMVRVMQKRDSDSISLFRRVVTASPRSIPALNNLAMLLADIPVERPEALKLINQAIDFAGEDASLLDTKGAILLYSGRSADAVPLLELATREPTADPRHHFHLALAYRDQGKIDDAKRHLQTALDRELASQVLTNTDQQLLTELRTALKL
jgi:tetratricopeptide (TPR) repeat protein